MNNKYSIGIDIGSTTVKAAVRDSSGDMIFDQYIRHNANISDTVIRILREAEAELGNINCTAAITGSGGLALSKKLEIPFIQEVIAVTTASRNTVPQADVVIELGGEDAKIIFLTNGVEQRMNGICAGGTGAFIDQMATLLRTDAGGLNELAKSYTEIYPIAARCGVFAKSDIQPLMNEGASGENLAASIFQAVVNQTISGLACGRRIRGTVVFLGGPLYFLSELQKAFVRTLGLDDEHAVFPEKAHMFAAQGAAVRSMDHEELTLKTLIEKLESAGPTLSDITALPALFESDEEYKRSLRGTE